MIEDNNIVQVVVGENPVEIYIDGVRIRNIQSYEVKYGHEYGNYVLISISFISPNVTGIYNGFTRI